MINAAEARVLPALQNVPAVDTIAPSALPLVPPGILDLRPGELVEIRWPEEILASLDADGNHRSFVLRGKQFTRFSVQRSDDFDVSDCAITGTDLLLLERRIGPLISAAIRIRKMPLTAIKDGALVDGTVLLQADLGYQIDNMEGLGVHRNAQGETILTLISDDNFSPIQRNLLLQFALVGE